MNHYHYQPNINHSYIMIAFKMHAEILRYSHNYYLFYFFLVVLKLIISAQSTNAFGYLKDQIHYYFISLTLDNIIFRYFLFSLFFLTFYFCLLFTFTRSAQSANAFGYGLFESSNTSLLHFTPFWTYSHRKLDDKTLRFFDNCPNYVKVKNNNNSLIFFSKKMIAR